MKSYDQTERRFDRKASFSVKLQEAESVNNFVKTETNMKNKEQQQLKAFLTREVISLAEVNDGVFLAGIMGEEIAIRPEEDTIYVPVILQGSIQFFDEMSETVMGYEREWQGKKMVVLCNFNRNKMHKYALRNILKILLERRTYVLYNKYIN